MSIPVAAPSETKPASRRLSLLLAGAIAGATVLLATIATPTQSAPQINQTPVLSDAAVTEAGRARQVATFASTYKQDVDPLITMPDGRQAKASSYYGVMIDGVRYYYNLAPHVSFDPLGRGEVRPDQIVVKERIMAADDFPVLVYTIPQ